MAPPPPPPPPPPMCLPFFGGSKKPKRLEYGDREHTETNVSRRSSLSRLQHSPSSSTIATGASHSEKFSTDSESYDLTNYRNEAIEIRPGLGRSETMKEKGNARVLPPIDEKGGSKKWKNGYGWGIGKKNKEKEMEREREGADLSRNNTQTSRPPPVYESPRPTRRNSDRSTSSSSSSGLTVATSIPPHMRQRASHDSPTRSNSQRTQSSGRTQGSSRRAGLQASDSASTLVGSILDRKMNDSGSSKDRPDSAERLEALRELMKKDTLDYYVIPSQDAHGSEYVGVNDKRVEWISGFTGSVAWVVVSKSSAYIIVDSRYWTQAEAEVDNNWLVIRQGAPKAPRDWNTWLLDRLNDSRVGIDARMIDHRLATTLNGELQKKKSKLVFPPQNLVDLIWQDKPLRSKEPIFVQPQNFAGEAASSKIKSLRDWIKIQPPTVSSYSKAEPKPGNKQVATLVSNLPCIAWLLNLRGDDIPFNPLFYSYLFVSLDKAILFVDKEKVTEKVNEYLTTIGVERQEYNDIWSFLRKKEWGEGKILITPETSYAMSLMLTSYRYTVAESEIESWKAVKNITEIEGLKKAYKRDGVAFVRWLAWLEYKMGQGYSITEYEAAWRLTEFRREGLHYKGLAYHNISAYGANASHPHYSPHKSTAIMIEKELPYLNDSGGQYLDGTCDTTRTVHFGRPTNEQCEAFTRVLQGHIAIDSAVFPAGTSGSKLDVLARRALWQDGMNYGHGTGHGVGSYLTVHEGPHGFSSDKPLVPGHVVTNEPGYYKEEEFGVRIESALFVKEVTTKHQYGGGSWYAFERLTCVPIQTKMVKESMLSGVEKQWLKDHNRRCFETLEPLLNNDKRALKWLRREAERGIGLASPVGNLAIEWD